MGIKKRFTSSLPDVRAARLQEELRGMPCNPLALDIRLKILREMPELAERMVSAAIEKLLVNNQAPTLVEEVALRLFNRRVLAEYRQQTGQGESQAR